MVRQSSRRPAKLWLANPAYEPSLLRVERLHGSVASSASTMIFVENSLLNREAISAPRIVVIRHVVSWVYLAMVRPAEYSSPLAMARASCPIDLE